MCDFYNRFVEFSKYEKETVKWSFREAYYLNAEIGKKAK